MTRERINVLLVEDNPADARLIAEMLKDAQAQVELGVAESLSAGIERLENSRIDVVLLDLGLTESTGLDTYRKLREKFPDIAIVVLTGLDDYEVATAAVREGAQDYLVKGNVDPNPLARSIRYAYDRKQAESALRLSEEKYRILFVANLAGVYRSTPEGKILECNEAMARMLGYRSPEELTKVKTPATYVDPAERQILLAQLEQRKSLRNYEIRLRTKSGETIWCLMNVVLMEESGERILQGNLVDITERKQVEEKLRMLARVVEQVGEGVAVAALNGELIFANGAWAAMHGLGVEEIIGKHLSIFHSKEQMPEVERFNKAVLTDGMCEGEVGHITLDGTPFMTHMTTTLLRDEVGNPAGFIGVVRDITEKKQTEEELRKLWRAVEQSPSITVITDREGTIEYVNPMFTEVTGYTAEEAIGQNPRILKSGYHPPEFYEAMWASLTSGLVWRGEFHNKKKNSELYWESAAIAPVKNEQGETTHYVAVKVDVTDRKRAEKALRERERRFRTLVNSIPQKIFVKDRELTYILCNPNYAADLGLEPEGIAGKTDFDFYPREMAEKYRADDARVMTSGEMEEIEEEYLQEGERRFVHTTKAPLRNDGGEVIGVLGVFHDVTDRKRAEMGIAQVATELRELIDTANAPILGVDVNGLVNEWNQKAVELTGFSQGDVLGRSMLEELVEPEHKSALSRVLYDAVVGIPTSNFEYGMKTKSGKPVRLMLNATPRRDMNGEIIGALGVGQDITELVEYREGLERKVEERTSELETVLRDTSEARDRIDAILKSVGDGLIVTDMYNRVVLMNRAAEELLGTRLSQAIGLPVDFAIDDATLRDRLRSTLDKRQEGYEFDFALPGAAGVEEHILSARTSLVRGSGGEVSGIVTIIHDVTHDREMDRMKTEFVSTAAHELRTPLTSIQGFSEILLTRDDLPGDKQKKYLSYINSEAVALANIINDLLDISRIESGKGFCLSKKHCDVFALFGRLTSVYRDRHPSHGFVTEFPAEPLEMFVDPDKMHQVLDNLLSNAVKYSPDGGTITVSSREVNGEIEVKVADQGLGMTPEQVARIFDKFYRADASNTAIEGTGLGMTIVKHIVKAHDGTVKAESELGEGTVVTIRLPRG